MPERAFTRKGTPESLLDWCHSASFSVFSGLNCSFLVQVSHAGTARSPFQEVYSGNSVAISDRNCSGVALPGTSWSLA